MRKLYSTVLIGVGLAWGVAHPAAVGAQGAGSVPTTELARPDATFSEPFSGITGLREMPDGRVMVADRIEAAVRLLDLQAGTAREIGREGQGPDEYRMPGRLFPLPGDSTLLVDFGNRRLTVIDPAGRLVRSAPMAGSGGAMIRAQATDAAGRVYFDQFGMVQVETGPTGQHVVLPDTVPLLRWDPATDALDTLAFLRGPKLRTAFDPMKGPGGLAAATAFAPRDAWAVAPDGRVAIVRAADYHVDWIGSDGRSRAGPTIPYEPVKVTRADEEAWADQLAANAVVSIQRTENGRRQGRTMNVPRPDIGSIDFPDNKPPFPPGAASVTPEGELWIERSVPHDASPTFDIFDATGHRVREVRLPKGRDVVGFGRGTLYAVRTDESGLQWLERYRR